MALGGGNFSTQNKVLPGAYINFIQASTASSDISERGIAAIPMNFDFAKDGEVFEVTATDFYSNSLELFGYYAEDEKMKQIREVYNHAVTAYFYRLNSGAKASCKHGEAAHSGIRGNDLKIVISEHVDDSAKYDVATYLGSAKQDTQTVAGAEDLIDNCFITFDKETVLEVIAGIPLTGGTNGTVTGTQHQAALDALESNAFHVLGCISNEEAVKKLYTAYTVRLRETCGVKFQCVVKDYAADSEGIINLKSNVSDSGADGTELIFWTVGAAAGCGINKSLTNCKYDGAYQIDTDRKQAELEKAINSGEFVFHKVGREIRVLEDINSLVTDSQQKGKDFRMNQVVRVLDQIGNDIALLFNEKYLGKIKNDGDGRVSLWSAITDYCKGLETIGAIDSFQAARDITVSAGNDKKSVAISCNIQPMCAMEKLYMTIYVN